jgi:hypothetical protein
MFERLERALRSEGPDAGFELLVTEALEQKNYALLFEVRQMQKRHSLGLSLIDTRSIAELPPEHQSAFQAAVADAARETGSLYLADGNIARAWPYFRAIGDPGPVAAAIESVESGEGIDNVIQIALQEGVNPRKGFELLLARRGMCQAIDFASQYTDPANRMALQMAEYGGCLSTMYHLPGSSPFEDLYVYHAQYLRALLGKEVDAAIAHFRAKVVVSVGGSAELLVGLLERLERFQKAIQILVEYLQGASSHGCPSAIQLCQKARDYGQLCKLAREQGEVLAVRRWDYCCDLA